MQYFLRGTDSRTSPYPHLFPFHLQETLCTVPQKSYSDCYVFIKFVKLQLGMKAETAFTPILYYNRKSTDCQYENKCRHTLLGQAARRRFLQGKSAFSPPSPKSRGAAVSSPKGCSPVRQRRTVMPKALGITPRVGIWEGTRGVKRGKRRKNFALRRKFPFAHKSTDFREISVSKHMTCKAVRRDLVRCCPMFSDDVIRQWGKQKMG